MSVIDPKLETTSYTYDLNGNMLTQTDGNGHTTTWEYNAANKVAKKIDHGGRTGSPGSYTYNPAKTESYTYYADGSIASKTDRNGNTFTYTYDIHGRLLSETAGQESITYTYDNNGNQLTMIDITGTTTRTYDVLNRVLTKDVPQIGLSLYAYDITTGVPTGCTAETTTDPKGHITQKVYDRVGRLSAVTADGATTTFTYFDNGTRQSVIYPDGSREDYTYYADNLNQTLTNRKADGTVIDTYSYTYDGAHNQTSKTDQKGTTNYTYDSLNRLETVTDPTGTVTKYTYDKAGNRLTEAVTNGGNTGVTIYSYNEQNRLLSTTTINAGTTQKVTYAYDNNGNMLTSATAVVQTAVQGAQAAVAVSAAGQSPTSDVTFNQYDVWNQLVKTTVGANTVISTYNGDWLRTSKTVNGQMTRYLYEYDHVVLEVDGQGNETARNVFGTNLLQRTDTGSTYYYMYNGHGDVTALLTTGGQIPATYYYDAFGNITEQTVTGNIYQPIKYAGYYFDDETGLYYLNARYYDSKIARFISEDSYTGEINNPLSLNLYTYTFNNPIKYTDPTGHIVTDWDMAHCSPSQIEAIASASVAWQVAYAEGDTAGMAAAHNAANAARTASGGLSKGDTIDSSGYVHTGSGNRATVTLTPQQTKQTNQINSYINNLSSSIINGYGPTTQGIKDSNQPNNIQYNWQRSPGYSTINTIYTVKSGDCLSKIALMYGTTIDEIAQANGMKNANVIYTGQALIIPSTGKSNIAGNDRQQLLGNSQGMGQNTTTIEATTLGQNKNNGSTLNLGPISTALNIAQGTTRNPAVKDVLKFTDRRVITIEVVSTIANEVNNNSKQPIGKSIVKGGLKAAGHAGVGYVQGDLIAGTWALHTGAAIEAPPATPILAISASGITWEIIEVGQYIKKGWDWVIDKIFG